MLEQGGINERKTTCRMEFVLVVNISQLTYNNNSLKLNFSVVSLVVKHLQTI